MNYLITREVTDDSLVSKLDEAVQAARDSEEGKKLRQEMIDRLMDAELEDVFLVSIPNEPMPQCARLHKTIPCAQCGEGTMETRLEEVNGLRLCRVCASKAAAQK